MPAVLLTGFEPFNGARINPSWEAVKLVADAPPAGIDVAVGQLPCRFSDSIDVLWELVERVAPAIVLSVGQADGRAEISVERLAVNLADARIPDNAGEQPVETAVVPDGPAAYFATIPVTTCVAAVRAAGLPAVVSQTAGTFVCNHVFYGLLHRAATTWTAKTWTAATRPGLRCGFVHVPLAPAQALAGGSPSMPVGATADALRAIIAAAAMG